MEREAATTEFNIYRCSGKAFVKFTQKVVELHQRGKCRLDFDSTTVLQGQFQGQRVWRWCDRIDNGLKEYPEEPSDLPVLPLVLFGETVRQDRVEFDHS